MNLLGFMCVADGDESSRMHRADRHALAMWHRSAHNVHMEHVPKVTRLSVNLAPTVAHALRSTASRRGLSITEAVRHAIAVWKLVTDEQDKGNRVIVEDRDGKHYREIVLL